MQKMNPAQRVKILPSHTDLCSFAITEEKKVIVPVLVNGYTLFQDSSNNRLVIGIIIQNEKELKDVTCSILGYSSTATCMDAMDIPANTQKEIEQMYRENSSSESSESNWHIVMKYLKNVLTSENV
ncbi:hypothetical protein NERG_02088 [Nematocida ausubeli]|uniref:Uncharacterized protein n=1 Tax=Nematocida ausubeli (strain ATCC PRA-371 / ERTm2) TaxID=1913371 RepID=H8ZER7_NEMA1|nr:hypothetical protein NERG_02088 [Nematocida ausubeli]